MIPRLLCLSLTVLYLAAHSASAQETPKTPPPEIGDAELQADGTLKVWISVPIPIPETRQAEEIVDGKAQPKLYTVVRWFPRLVEKQLTPDRFLVVPVGGEKQDQEGVKTLFDKRGPALFVTHGKLLDPHYAASFQPGTPVVYIRRNIRWSSMGPIDADQQAPIAIDAAAPGGATPDVPMMPIPAIVHVRDGKLHVRTFAWTEFPLASRKVLSKEVTTPEGPRTVTQSETTVTSVWAPTPQDETYQLTASRVLDSAGQARADFDWTSVSKPTSAFWLPRGATVDARVSRFLKEQSLIVETSNHQTALFPFGSACGPILDFRLAVIEGGQLKFSKPVFEQHVRKIPYSQTVDGIEVTRYKEVYSTVTKLVHLSASLGQLEAIDGAGNEIPEPQLRERLKTSTPVLVSDFPAIAPSQLRLLNAATIILKPKPSQVPGAIVPEPQSPPGNVVPSSPPVPGSAPQASISPPVIRTTPPMV